MKIHTKKALLSGIPAFMQKIIANRNIPFFITPKRYFNPSLKGLDVYKLKDIKKQQIEYQML